mgnify:CR=1 FL=1
MHQNEEDSQNLAGEGAPYVLENYSKEDMLFCLYKEISDMKVTITTISERTKYINQKMVELDEDFKAFKLFKEEYKEFKGRVYGFATGLSAAISMVLNLVFSWFMPK